MGGRKAGWGWWEMHWSVCWWIFSSCFPRRWVWLTEPRSYFTCLPPNCISGASPSPLSLSVSQQDKEIFLSPILLTLFCAVTEYNGHHHIQWILLTFSLRILSACATALWEHKYTLFLVWSDIWTGLLDNSCWYCGVLSSLNAIMKQLSSLRCCR